MMAARLVLHARDEFGPIEVYDEGGRRFMAFGPNDEQCCQLKAAPAILQHDYARAMLLPLLFMPAPHNITLFGLGGGCLASALLRHLRSCRLQVVELRQAVIDIAFDYFQLPNSARMQILNMDVADYLAGGEVPAADLVLSDIYGADGLDLHQLDPDFLRRSASLVRPGGWLVINCWNQHRREREALAELASLFAEIFACSTAAGNWVLLATREPVEVSKAELRERARKLSAKLGFPVSASLGRLKRLELSG
jgi:spermidine synthase